MTITSERRKEVKSTITFVSMLFSYNLEKKGGGRTVTVLSNIQLPKYHCQKKWANITGQIKTRVLAGQRPHWTRLQYYDCKDCFHLSKPSYRAWQTFLPTGMVGQGDLGEEGVQDGLDE